MTCPVCGTVAIPKARYCHSCGNQLPEAAARGFTAERRLVTVLFGDLSDFTAWAEDLDPERVGHVTDRVLVACTQAVTTFGGHVDKLTGDGIMAVFGAPVAHEDDPERAVRAALAMQRAVKRIIDDEVGGGRMLGLRVGINTGAVVAGVQAAFSYTVIGDTVNTAARLSDAAGIGAVYAGARTARATRDHAAWRRLSPLRLKGKRELVEAYELLGLQDAPGIRPGLGDEAPFVGREAELGRILGRFVEVIEGSEPQAIVLTAEAGAGKTRLAAEVARHGGTEFGARVLQARCMAYGEARRLAPLAELARQACGVEPDDDPEQAIERVRRIVGRLGQQHASDVLTPGGTDVLLELLGFGAGSEAPTPVGSLAAPGARRGDPVPLIVAELLTELATAEPLLLVVDDIHNASTETLDVLGVLVAAVTGPVLVLLLGRPEVVRTGAVFTRISGAEPLPLPPLAGAAVSRLLRSYLGGQLAPEDETHLLATAQGNPFYLAELVSLLLEQGRLTGAGSGWRLAPDSLTGQLLSSDLAVVLAARIDTLPSGARAVLRAAAVSGDRIPEGALEALLGVAGVGGGGTRNLAEQDWERALAELISRRMLRRAETGGYVFVTTLMREAAYSRVGRAELANRHAQLAQWADGRSIRGLTDGERDEFVAHHTERALRYAGEMLLPSGHDARMVAPLGAAALGRLASTTLSSGDTARALSLLDRAVELVKGNQPPQLRLVRARALLATGKPAEALVVASALTELRTGDADAAEEISVATWVAAFIVTGEAQLALGDRKSAVAAWSAAIRHARRADGLAAQEGEALRRIGMLDYLAGRLRLAEERFGRAYRGAIESGDMAGQGWALQHMAWSATSRGDFAAAEEALSRARDVFADLGDPAGRSWVRGTEAIVRLLEGRYAEARRLADEFIPFGERVGEVWAVAALRTVGAFAASELGELTHAEEQAMLAANQFVANGDAWGRSFALIVRGLVARGRGRIDEALPLLTEAEQVSGEAVHPLTTGIALTVRGDCHLAADNPVEAEADARKSLALLAGFDVDSSVRVGPLVLLAQARWRQGDLAEARDLLAEVAVAAGEPSLLFPRRHALAHYAAVLLESGQPQEALQWARRAQTAAAEDVRSRVVTQRTLARALAAVGRRDEALVAAESAVRLAYATEQVCEQAESDAVRNWIVSGEGIPGDQRGIPQARTI